MSFESDRQPLLAETILPLPHCSAASFVSVATVRRREDGPVSPSQSATNIADTASTVVLTERPYRGFPSEADYLAALRAWAEEKQYIQLDTAMVGWYGKKTKEDYLNRSGLRLGTRSKAQKEEERRATTSGESGRGNIPPPAPKSHQQSALRWPRRATLSKSGASGNERRV